MWSEINQRPDMTMYGKLAQHKVGYVAGQLEITSECNQKCIDCKSWRQHTTSEIRGTVSRNSILSIISELNDMPTFEHLTLTGGEPQSWKDPNNDNCNFDSLLYLLNEKKKFSLQVNTNLTQQIDYRIWKEALSRVRVSLDGVTRETYAKIRGDINTNPVDILNRMDRLNHPGLATMTCVSKYNIDEVPMIIGCLNEMNNPPRKAMFLPAMGIEHSKKFELKYRDLERVPSPRVSTSFVEDSQWVRTFVNSEEAQKVPCYVGGITFHIKCTGEVYPCCLIGGEAVVTQQPMALGHLDKQSLWDIQRSYSPFCRYIDGSPCQEFCQWKQLNMNRIVHEATKTILTMP